MSWEIDPGFSFCFCRSATLRNFRKAKSTSFTQQLFGLLIPTLSCSSCRVDMQSLSKNHRESTTIPSKLFKICMMFLKCWSECAQNRLLILLFALKPTTGESISGKTPGSLSSPSFQRLVEKIEASRLEPKNGHWNWWSFIAPQCSLLTNVSNPKPKNQMGFWSHEWPKLRPHTWRQCLLSRPFCTSKLKTVSEGSQSENFQASMPFYHSLPCETLKQLLFYDLSHCLAWIF